jgi:hypothetical protein
MRNAIVPLCLLALSIPASTQEKYEKFAVYVAGMGTAKPVADALIKKLNESKPFVAVAQKDPSKVVVLVSCMDHKTGDPMLCLYVSHYNGATFKTFMGAGNFVAMDADTMATNFLSAIAQDIVERFDDMNTQNLTEALETCLLMTDSKCNVPDPLQKKFGEKQLTLGLYLMKKNK